jgi:hypothetical protein
MLVHTKCQNTVLATLPNSVRLLAEIGAASDCRTLQIIKLHVFKIADVEERFSFFCLNCNKEVALSEVSGQCRQCGNFFSIKDLKIPQETGGTYCPEHIKRFTDERHFNLEIILSKSLTIR